MTEMAALTSLLGRSLRHVLGSELIRSLGKPPMEERIEDSLHIHFAECPVELRFSSDRVLTSIFLTSPTGNLEWTTEVPFGATREHLLRILGEPSRSGAAQSLPILGFQGAWDRWDRPDSSLHVQYSLRDGAVEKITLMHPAVVPK
jgi:hypothetical protein